MLPVVNSFCQVPFVNVNEVTDPSTERHICRCQFLFHRIFRRITLKSVHKLFIPCWELHAYVKNSLVRTNAYFGQFKLLSMIPYLSRCKFSFNALTQYIGQWTKCASSKSGLYLSSLWDMTITWRKWGVWDYKVFSPHFPIKQEASLNKWECSFYLCFSEQLCK